MKRLLPSALGIFLIVGGCNDPGANVDITDTHLSRDTARHVIVDFDLLAREAMGGSIGIYCTRVTFTGETGYHETCTDDLHDGDTKNVRVTSERTDIAAGAVINVNVRLAVRNINAGRLLNAPP